MNLFIWYVIQYSLLILLIVAEHFVNARRVCFAQEDQARVLRADYTRLRQRLDTVGWRTARPASWRRSDDHEVRSQRHGGMSVAATGASPRQVQEARAPMTTPIHRERVRVRERERERKTDRVENTRPFIQSCLAVVVLLKKKITFQVIILILCDNNNNNNNQ